VRHLGSIVLSLLFGAAIYALTGVALLRGAGLREGLSSDALVGVGAAAIAGLLYAVLVMARLSPLGPVLLGLAFLGVAGWVAAYPESFNDTMPAEPFGEPGVLTLPAMPMTVLLAVPLLATIVSPRRWRRSVRPAPAEPADYPPTADTAPLGQHSQYGAPTSPPYGSPYPGPQYPSGGYPGSSYGSSSYGSPPAYPSFHPPDHDPWPPHGDATHRF
jgi:hypothetical protein